MDDDDVVVVDLCGDDDSSDDDSSSSSSLGSRPLAESVAHRDRRGGHDGGGGGGGGGPGDGGRDGGSSGGGDGSRRRGGVVVGARGGGDGCDDVDGDGGRSSSDDEDDDDLSLSWRPFAKKNGGTGIGKGRKEEVEESSTSPAPGTKAGGGGIEASTNAVGEAEASGEKDEVESSSPGEGGGGVDRKVAAAVAVTSRSASSSSSQGEKAASGGGIGCGGEGGGTAAPPRPGEVIDLIDDSSDDSDYAGNASTSILDGDEDALLAAEALASASASASAAATVVTSGETCDDDNGTATVGAVGEPARPSPPRKRRRDGADSSHRLLRKDNSEGGDGNDDVVVLLSSSSSDEDEDDDDEEMGRKEGAGAVAKVKMIEKLDDDDDLVDGGVDESDSDDDDDLLLPRGPTFRKRGGDSSSANSIKSAVKGKAAATVASSKRGRCFEDPTDNTRLSSVPTPVTQSQQSQPSSQEAGAEEVPLTSSQVEGKKERSRMANPYTRPRGGKTATTSSEQPPNDTDDDDDGGGGGDVDDPNLIPTPPPPVINEIGGKLYPDLRHHFIRSLHEHARKSRHAAHNRSVFDSTLRAIAVLSLREHPVRSHDACRRVKGIGEELRDVLRESSETFLEGMSAAGTAADGGSGRGRGGGSGRRGAKSPYRPPIGKFCAAAPAALVALLNYESDRRQHRGKPSSDGGGEGGTRADANANADKNASILCPMEELLRGVNALLDDHPTLGGSRVLDQPTEYYLDGNVLDVEFGQIRKLCSENVHAGLEAFVKERRRKDLCPSGVAFELLPHGRSVARRLRRDLRQEEEEDATSGSNSDNGRRSRRDRDLGPLRQLASSSVHKDYASVTMCVDFREGGGGGKSLHHLCDLLDDHRVPYVVRELRISDYIFFVGDRIAPILIERKTVDDVANSLADGRWERQQRNMRMAQFVLGGGAERRCQICYLIEGDASRRVVHGGNVGRRSWNQSLEDVENAIANLPKLGFSVMRSKSRMGTMVILSRVAKDVAWKARNGSIDAPHTYDEFLRRMKQCPEREGDPPVLAEHQYPAPPVVDDYANRGGGGARATDTSSSTAGPAAARSSSDPPNRRTVDGSHVHDEEADGGAEADEDAAALSRLSVQRLKEMCKERFEACSGKKGELIGRLLKPRKPEAIITRLRRGQYVPKVPSCNAALMVALLLNQSPSNNAGIAKESLMAMAEETGVSKDPMSGNGGFYDGWSGMKDLLSGDPALVYVKKKKYSLTTHPAGSAGVDIARALHLLAHRERWCKCGDQVIDAMT